MKSLRVLLVPLALSLALAFGAIPPLAAGAQGTCPTSGTHGKDVGSEFFAKVVAQLKDVPQSTFAVQALMAWKPLENTNAFWNPLATTWKLSPVCNFNSVGVQNYVDEASGVRATANTLNLGYYDSIRAMLRRESFDREAMRASLGTWGTCHGSACDALLNTWQGLYGTPANTPPASGPAGSSSTVLIFDTSGSMGDPDPSGVSKLAASQHAGGQLLDVIGAENKAGLSSANQTAIVQFGDNASVETALTMDVAAAQRVLDGLYPSGATAMPKGLRAGLDLFPPSAGPNAFIILLTDGLANIGLNDEPDEAIARQQVLDLASEAGRRGICIYTVGFGDPASGSIDEGFLEDVASNSGCGSYHNARDAWQLANVYIGLRHASTGQTLISKSGSIAQGQLVDIGNVQIPDNQSVILFTLNWPGSQLDALLRDPGGKLVDSAYPGASITPTDTLASVIIQNPISGLWSISAQGVNVPGGTTTYNAVLSVRPNPNPPMPTVAPTPATTADTGGGGALAIVLVILALSGLLTYILVINAQRRGRGTPVPQAVPASFAALNGSFAGHSIPLQDGLLIGRGSMCALRFDDPSVSRQHARVRYASGRWYLQDLKSQLGTFVNGARVSAIALNKGDRIRIGRIEFVFS